MNGPRKVLALVTCTLFWSTIAYGRLIWGVGGNGGGGAWDTTTANWWNGSANVPWTNGGAAIFAGSGGVVTTSFPGPVASSITFDAPGYSIQGGWLNGGSALTITTNQPATISSTLSDSVIDGVLVKNGAAILTVSGTNFIDRLQINSGEYLVGGSGNLFFSDVTIANTAGALVTLGQNSDNISIGSLSGGCASGRILQPDNRPRTVAVTIAGTEIFRGVAQDNGSAKLGLRVSFASSAVALAGTNTYSGPTTVSSGTLTFSENGSALNSASTASTGGKLRLDNTTTALANRLSDSLDVTVQNGVIEFVGNSSVPIEEQLGILNFSGALP